jgi:hypothetical protein
MDSNADTSYIIAIGVIGVIFLSKILKDHFYNIQDLRNFKKYNKTNSLWFFNHCLIKQRNIRIEKHRP